jgi:hypothetical protein
MDDRPDTASRTAPPARVRRRPGTWAGYAGAAWALAYVPIHLYWALGGGAAFLGVPDPDAAFRTANWGASVVLAGAALVSLALVRPEGRVVPGWMLLGVAWVGSVASLLHWVTLSAVAVLHLTGAVEVQAAAGRSVEQLLAYDRWNLLVFEPWFLGMGLLLAAAAGQHRRLRPAERVGPPPRVGAWAGYAGVVWAAATGVAARSWAVGALAAVAALLLLALARPWGRRLPRRRLLAATRVASAALTLGGLVLVLWGVFRFQALTFALVGPWVLAGGVLFELATWPRRPQGRPPMV